MPNPEYVSRFDQLVRDGGPFVIVAFVLASLFLGVCYAIYRFVAKPALELQTKAGEALAIANKAAQATALSAENAASDARLAADASKEAIKIAQTMQDTNKQMFQAMIEHQTR